MHGPKLKQRYRREERLFCLPQRRSSAFDETGVAELQISSAAPFLRRLKPFHSVDQLRKRYPRSHTHRRMIAGIQFAARRDDLVSIVSPSKS